METGQKNIDTILCEAVEITSAEEREAYLDRVCGDDTALRREAERLITDHFEAGDFLEKPAVVPDPTIDQRIVEKPGTQIGPYKLLQQIGEGGFGLVYMAEQSEPVRRRAALKIIKPGMDTQAVIARFEAEQQALAMMDHPSIAKVLDAGVTASGRPYFAMELVKGQPITEYCDHNRLTTTERLRLFVVVCRAIQHAHQKGIIHRDIKPSNVLVTLLDGKAVPKVIDFGVAKAINQQLTERTLFTAYGQMVGTPQYMSPEQADISALDVDTRSDVYSLGVLLYELLTGCTPLDAQQLRSLGYAKIQQLIREEEPSKPSTRISTIGEQLAVIARDRNIDPDKLVKLLSGDLDWIVLKALDKERGRRYESASALAADAERFLREEPIEARPPSAGYRLRKLVRRNKGPAAAAVLLLCSLLLGIVGTSIGMIRASMAESVAQQDASRARRAEATARDRLDEVRRQQHAAEQARKEAERARGEAVLNANRAEKMLAQVETALRFADGLRLTAEASKLLNENPGLSLLLAIEGTKQKMPLLDVHNDALLAALRECRELRTLYDPAADPDDKLINKLTAARISPDGKLVAAACARMERAGYNNTKDDKLALVWDVASGRHVSSFRVPGIEVRSLSFTPDGRLLLATFAGGSLVEYEDGKRVVYTDRVARLWNAATGEEVAVLRGHTDRVATARFNADGTRIVTASWDKTARVWDAKSGQQLAVMQGSPYSLDSAEFNRDGTRVLTVPSGSVQHSSAAVPRPGEKEAEIDPLLHQGEPLKYASPRGGTHRGGRVLSSQNVYSAPRVWNASTGEQLHVLAIKLNPPAISVDLKKGTTRFSVQSGRVRRGESPPPTDPTPTAGRSSTESLASDAEETLCACFSPTGRHIATGSWKGTVTVWDANDGTAIKSWKKSVRRIRSIAYSSDGKQLLLVAAHGSRDQQKDEVSVWDASDGRELAHWNEFPAGVRDAKFSPDGQAVLILPGNLERQEEAKRTPGMGGEKVLMVPEDRGVYVRSVETGEDISVYRGHDSIVTSAAFDDDGSKLVTSAEDGTVRLWDTKVDLKYETVLGGHAGIIGKVAFSADGRYALTTYGRYHRHASGFRGGERGVRIWDAKTGELLRTLRGDEDFRDLPIRDQILGAVRHAEFHPNRPHVLSVSLDPFVRQLAAQDPATDKPKPNDPPPVQRLATGQDVSFSPVRVWDAEHGELRYALTGLAAGILHAEFSPDGKRIVTVCDNSYRYVTLDSENKLRGSGTTTGRDKSVRVWDAQSGEQLQTLLGEDHNASWATWSPDGRFLLTISYDHAAHRSSYQLWNASTLARLHELVPSKTDSPIEWGVFNSRGNRLLAFHREGFQTKASLWDLESGRQLADLPGNVNDAAFSPDGKWVVTAEADWTARFWDASSGEQIWSLAGHQGPVRTVAFSPDGRWFATGSDDATARIWRTTNGSAFFTLTGHQGPVYSVAFSPDSASVITGSGDGTARSWPIDPLPRAKSRTFRPLTEAERQRFQIGRATEIRQSR